MKSILESLVVLKLLCFVSLGALDLITLENFSLKKCKKSKLRASESIKTADFPILEPPKLISREIWVTEKFFSFYIVGTVAQNINESQYYTLF